MSARSFVVSVDGVQYEVFKSIKGRPQVYFRRKDMSLRRVDLDPTDPLLVAIARAMAEERDAHKVLKRRAERYMMVRRLWHRLGAFLGRIWRAILPPWGKG